MRFSANELQVNTLKEGLKLTVYIEKDERKEVLSQISNFIDKPLKVDINIDAPEREKELSQITGQQRKKIYALFNDIDEYTGQGAESIKEQMKKMFLESESNSWGESFSLADCPKELASDFIEWLIDFSFQNGIELSEHPKNAFENIKNYIKISLKNKVCAICGKPGETHHVDTIGMGRDRTKVDDGDHKKICLCRKHHNLAHNSGWKTFKKNYHVTGVSWKE